VGLSVVCTYLLLLHFLKLPITLMRPFLSPLLVSCCCPRLWGVHTAASKPPGYGILLVRSQMLPPSQP
jgi:hypothetical protein